MRKYTVGFEKQEYLEIEVEAENINAAVDLAHRQAPIGFRPEAVESEDGSESGSVAGHCEVCGKCVLDGDNYISDTEAGLQFHHACVVKSRPC